MLFYFLFVLVSQLSHFGLQKLKLQSLRFKLVGFGHDCLLQLLHLGFQLSLLFIGIVKLGFQIFNKQFLLKVELDVFSFTCLQFPNVLFVKRGHSRAVCFPNNRRSY